MRIEKLCRLRHKFDRWYSNKDSSGARRTTIKDWKGHADVKLGMQVSCYYFAKISQKGALYKIQRRIGETLRDLCRQKRLRLEEGKTLPDHIHMLLNVLPKYGLEMLMGYLKGKGAVRI